MARTAPSSPSIVLTNGSPTQALNSGHDMNAWPSVESSQESGAFAGTRSAAAFNRSPILTSSGGTQCEYLLRNIHTRAKTCI